MRRMRGFAWYHLLFAVPALGAAFGVQYFMRKNYPTSTNSDSVAVIKPSFFRADAGATAQSGAARAVASTHPVKSTSHEEIPPIEVKKLAQGESLDDEDDLELKEEHKAELAALKEAHIEKIEDRRGHSPASASPSSPSSSSTSGHALPQIMPGAHALLHRIEPQRLTASTEQDFEGLDLAAEGMGAVGVTGMTGGENAGSECRTLEYRADGPQASATSNQDWDHLLLTFSQVKNDLGNWLSRYSKGFPEKDVEFMRRQLDLIRLRRPPIVEQPDLAWRGIAVYVMEGKNPAIHVGPGFLKLIHNRPARGKFELARLITQSWAPCEILAGSGGDIWTPLLACLGVVDHQACSVGSTSEAGWAVSTALAAMVENPGCEVPAFHDPKAAVCIKKVPTPLIMARNAEEHNQ